MSIPEDDTDPNIFACLKSLVRRKILLILSQEPKSFSDLQNEFEMESSNLSYHLNGLGSLLLRTADGKYALSSIGEVALSIIKEGEELHVTPLPSRVVVQKNQKNPRKYFKLGKFQVPLWAVVILMVSIVVSGVLGSILWTSFTVPLQVNEPIEIMSYPSQFSLFPGETANFNVTVTNHASISYSAILNFKMNDSSYQENYVSFSDQVYNVTPGQQNLQADMSIATNAPAANLTISVNLMRLGNSTAITIDTSSDSINLPSRNTVEVGGYFFAFYAGTDLHLYVNSSSDGLNWNTGQDVSGSSLCEPWAFGVFTDGSNIICGFANGSDATVDPNATTGWTVMGTESNGLITWNTPVEIRQAVGWWYSGFTFAKTSAGDWWVGFQCSFKPASPYYEVYVYNSTNGENWTQSFASADFQLETSGYPGGVGICSWPQYPNGIMLVASAFGEGQYGYVTFDGSNWTSVMTFGSKIPYDYTRNGFSLVAGNGQVQFVTVPATFTMGNQAYVGGAITYYAYGTSWSPPVVVDASTCFSPSLTAYDNSTLYLFYRNSLGVCYRSMDYSTGTWSAATSLVRGETTVNSYGPISEEYPTGTSIGLMWLAGSQSPYDVRFTSLTPGNP